MTTPKKMTPEEFWKEWQEGQKRDYWKILFKFAAAYSDHVLAAYREEREEKLEQALRELVEQFHAYQNGWMGVGVWRTRIGLPAALEQAVKLLDKREG